MTHKVFPWTKDGDQISISFDHAEEKTAFLSALEDVERFVQQKAQEGIVKGELKGFTFGTTLKYEVASAKSDEIRRIVGLHAFNPWSKNSVSIMLTYEHDE